MKAFPKTMLVLMLVVGLAGGRLVAHIDAAPLAPRVTLEVNNLNDSGPGSLRQAILDANAVPGADQISITANGLLPLVSALPTITEAVTIDVPGSNTFRLFIVDGQNSHRGFTIGAVPVTISGLTVQNAAAFGNLSGGGIYSEGDLTLAQVLVLNSHAGGRGGGVYSAGSLLVNGGRYEENSAAAGGGGGIAAAGDLVVIDSTIRNNRCPALDCHGGGLNVTARLTLTNTVIADNESTGQGGGAWATGPMQVSGGSFERNLSRESGGGFYANNGLTLDGTVVITNSAVETGGGVYANAPVSLVDAHFENNASLQSGGGMLIGGPGTTFLDNVDFVRNYANDFGGGLYAGIVRIVGGRFQGNHSDLWVGGLYAYDNVVLTNTQFISNTGGTYGGVLAESVRANGGLFEHNSPGALAASNAVLTGTTFLSNTGAPAVTTVTTLVASGVRFADNSSPTLAGGLVAGGATLHNSEFVRNTDR